MIHQRSIGVALIAVALVGGTLLVVHERGQAPEFGSTIIPSTPSPTIATVPTPAWYEAHPDVLKKDNNRCDAEGKIMPPGLCANVAIADKAVSSQDALDALDQAGSSEKN
jgi:hypothetical protein